MTALISPKPRGGKPGRKTATRDASVALLTWWVLMFAGAPAVAKPNVAKLADKCSVQGKQSACAELANLARSSKDSAVRLEAVSRLSDQVALAAIADRDEEPSVRQAAAERLKDQSSLAMVAAEAPDAKIRAIAAKKLTDQASLAKIATGDSDGEVRQAAVARVVDSSLLGKVAVDAQDANIRNAAVRKLKDQTLLAKIAVEDKEANVRQSAVANVANQASLSQIALNSQDARVRAAAATKLTDQDLLARIAREDKEDIVVSAAREATQRIQQESSVGRDVSDLLIDHKIQVLARGNGINQVLLEVKSLVNYPLAVNVPIGTFFSPASADVQHMVATSAGSVRLAPGGSGRVFVNAACADRGRSIPYNGDSFSAISRSPGQEDLAKLMSALGRGQLQIDQATMQAAVWIITGDADYDGLGTLISGRANFYPLLSGDRVIREYQAAHAMKICADAMIDIAKKKIWQDRARILSGLKRDQKDDVISWLERQQ